MAFTPTTVLTTCRHCLKSWKMPASSPLENSLPVGFKVLDVPLEKPAQGSFNAFLEDNGLVKEITFTNLNAPSGIDFSAIRSQSAYVATSVKEAFDGVINLPEVSIDKTVFLNKE